MKKKLLLILSALTIFFAFVNQNAFNTVVNHQTNKTVKEKLIQFEKGGIEKLVTKTVDVNQLVVFAESYLKTPHKMGGVTKKGIDCSGLVMVSFNDQGISLPHSAHEQARFGKIVPAFEDLKKGDIVFFYNSYTTKNLITHSGIYKGGGEFIHTSNSKGVVISKVKDPYYWGERFLFGTRLN